jgi:hypothetical protein
LALCEGQLNETGNFVPWKKNPAFTDSEPVRTLCERNRLANISQSTCLEMLHPKTDEHVNPSVEVHHLVGELSTAEKYVCISCTIVFL